MPMRTQRLLYLSAHQMSAYSWQAGSLTVEDRFAANEDGYSAFAAYLEHHPQSTYRLLANIAEEGFQIEVIPYLRGRDRQTVINRKLGQYFFGANLTAALSLGYEKTKRKDERLLLDRVAKMADSVRRMLEEALDAFVRHDASVAARLVECDERVDADRETLRRDLMQRMAADPAAVSAALDMIFVVQSIERIGDHAKNIAEYVVNVVEGIDRRQAPAAPREAAG